MSIQKLLPFLFLTTFIFSSSAQDVQFSDLFNLPQERSAITSANDGQYIYVANGFGINAPYTKEIYRFHIASNSWTLLTDQSLSKRYASAEIINDKLYLFNGALDNGSLNNKVEVINLNDGSISFSTDNPQPARVSGVSSWNGKIYSFGGTVAPNVYSNKLYEFDPQTEVWTELAAMPINGETKGEIVNGKLYVFGGYNGTASNKIDIYDIASDTWETQLTMPFTISGHATAIIGTKIYLVGDYSNLTSLASFETTDNTFTTLASNLTGRRHCAAEGVNGQLIAIGGNTTSSIQSSISSVQVADILSSLEKVESYLEFSLHPNPTTHLLNWEFQFESVIITNLHGRTIQVYNSPIQQINVEHYPQGIYFLLGKSKENWYRTKWVKN